MKPDAQEALKQLSQLWRRERDATRARFREERDEIPLKERVARGLALRDLRVGDTDPAPGGMTLVWLHPKKPERLRDLRLTTGDPVVLWLESPTGPDAVQGTLARRRSERVGVMIQGDPSEALEDAGHGVRLDREDPGATFDRGDAALQRFRDAPTRSPLGRMRAVLLGGGEAEFGPDPSWEPLDPDLNEPQRAAVTRALAARDVALIHGPPGTGKTRTLVEVIRQAVARGERVLATAASNMAVDNLAERLVDAGTEVVRLGHPARVAPALEPCLLSARVDASEAMALARSWIREAHKLRQQFEKRRAKRRMDWEERRAARSEINRLFRDARLQLQRTQEVILARAPVVCATAAGADATPLGELVFDLVVVDEATQSPDPITFVALARGERTVLAGDPCQLPPTVIDPRAERDGLGTTLFERLARAEQGDLLRLLVVQHRMHEQIMAFPSRSKYEDKLVAAPAVAAHRLEDLPDVRPDPLRPGPLVFVDTAGKGWEDERAQDDPSTRNPGQAERVALEVRRILSRGLPPGDLAVIAPYYAQVRLLRDLLRPEQDAGLEIRSVDGFQGREKEAIVVDLVRSNDQGAVGFLRDTRRMNVALTRARRFLLVVGDSATIGQHPYYAEFLAAVEQVEDGWVSAWSDEAEPLEPA